MLKDKSEVERIFKSSNSKMNTNHETIELGDICIHVICKDIKNIHLSVHPPHGRVTIAAPLHMDKETIRLFSVSKLGWIRKQQTKLRNQKEKRQGSISVAKAITILGKDT